MKTYIFDLDHTVIDSTHRQLTRADGSLDLAHWIENNTPEKIAADSLLPIANLWKAQQMSANNEIVVCTARVFGAADAQFLDDHGLYADAILSRPMGDSSPDWMLKERLLRQYASDTGRSWARFCLSAVMYDDNESVVKMAYLNNIDAYNAIELNKSMVA
jgi:FMN phosphatase YigB (HAD superfamily)